MSIDAISAWGIFAGFIPFLAIIVILLHYSLRRVLWRRGKRLGKSNLGFYPTSFALGMALQFMQVYWKPSVAYVLEEKQDSPRRAGRPAGAAALSRLWLKSQIP
jgi:hypothetical protein